MDWDTQDWAREHGTEGRFSLLCNPQAAGLRERKNGMLKQCLKLLTDKATVAGCTNVPSKAFTHLHDQRVALSPHIPDWGPLRKHRCQKGTSGNSRCPDFHHGSTCYGAENTKLRHTWERRLSTGICTGTLTGWVRGNYSISTGFLLSCRKLGLLKRIIPGMECAPLEKRR